MPTLILLAVAPLVLGVCLANMRQGLAGAGAGNNRPELEYSKAVNPEAPPQEPALLFLLMGEYSNANLHGEGAEFFTGRLKQFGPRLANTQKALYLSAIGLLRAQYSSSVPLLQRVGYLKDTVAIAGIMEAAFGRKDIRHRNALPYGDRLPFDRGFASTPRWCTLRDSRPEVDRF